MWMTRETDYGVQALVFLGSVPEGTVVARPAIAEQLDIPNEFLAKVLRKLARAGLIRSHAGSKGGYSLSRPLGEIDVAGVIEAIDGPIAFARCLDGAKPPCRRVCACEIREGMARIQGEVRRLLARHSMAEVARRSVGEGPLRIEGSGAEEGGGFAGASGTPADLVRS
jgi:Rrf2 family protein